MDDDVGRGDSVHQTLEESSLINPSAPAIENVSVVLNNTHTESGTNPATSPETEPATSEDMDTTASTTLGVIGFDSSCDGQEPVKESTSDNKNSEIHIEPGTKQEYVAVGSSEGALSSGKTDSDVSITTNSIEETVLLKDDVAISCNDILSEHKTEQENPLIVSTEDMEVSVTNVAPVATDPSKMVSQPDVASVTNLEFLQKCEGLSSITQYRGDSSDDLSDRYAKSHTPDCQVGWCSEEKST